MTKSDFEKFKDQIIENLETLKFNLEECEKMGLEDFDENLYNQITDLIDETESSDEMIALSEIIVMGKTIETRLDSWLANTGFSNLELIWPKI